jgi:hypothetical protein
MDQALMRRVVIDSRDKRAFVRDREATHDYWWLHLQSRSEGSTIRIRSS